MANSINFNQIALEVFQVAIADLIGGNLPDVCKRNGEENEIIQKARDILGLNREVNTLSLLFDRIKLPDGEGADQNHYVPLHEIVSNSEGYPKIPYPIAEQPDFQKYQARIVDEIKTHLNSDRWNDLSFLTFILEKYGSCVSYGDSHTALVDAARMTAAVAVALSQNQESGAEEKFHLVAGSLSGIQKFIYTISSDGALKSLRARSFYLELVAEEIVQQILDELKLPRTNVIYAGGGNLFILTSDSNNSLKSKLENLRNRFNKWLEERFKGKIFLSLACSSCNKNDVKSSSFGNCWKNVISELAKQKSQKFSNQIKNGGLLNIKPSYQPCKVCHRDDVKVERLKSLHEGSDVLACPTCRKMFRLGGQLFKTKAILRSQRPKILSDLDREDVFVEVLGKRYYLFEDLPDAKAIQDNERIILINDFDIKHYCYTNCNLLMLGNYSQQGEEGFMRAEEMTEKAKDSGCIPRVGYLRMDVDRLGQIFAKGLPNKEDSPHNIDEYSLPRAASLSRQMSYFFKVYLNSLAGDRANNLPENAKILTTESDKNFSRRNLMFIYAGGDDLFISGAWNEVVEFAFDIHQSFQAYTGNHPNITISGGISIDDAKFPLYQSAKSSGDAEGKAKANNRDSLGLFGEAFKWEEWLGMENVQAENISSLKKAWEYIKTKEELKLFGVLAIAKAIQNLLKSDAQVSRNFTRNLLATAQIQEQKIEEFEDKRTVKQYENQDKDIRYFLHLPKIAYTLSRLPDRIRGNPEFSKISTSLKSPYNAPYFRAIATWIELLNRSQ